MIYDMVNGALDKARYSSLNSIADETDRIESRVAIEAFGAFPDYKEDGVRMKEIPAQDVLDMLNRHGALAIGMESELPPRTTRSITCAASSSRLTRSMPASAAPWRMTSVISSRPLPLPRASLVTWTMMTMACPITSRIRAPRFPHWSPSSVIADLLPPRCISANYKHP